MGGNSCVGFGVALEDGIWGVFFGKERENGDIPGSDYLLERGGSETVNKRKETIVKTNKTMGGKV